MSSFVISKSSLNKKGRELMLDFYSTIHDDYFLETFDDFKAQKKYYDENVIKEYKRVLFNDNRKLCKDKHNNLIYFSIGSNGEVIPFDKDVVPLEGKELLMHIEKKIKNKSIEMEFIYDFLSRMDEKLKLDKNLEFECYEELFCLKKAFLKAYELFHYDGYNLED